MKGKEWKKWLYWFSFAVAIIIVYKTIDSVTEIFTVIGEFIGLMMPFVMAIIIAYILYLPSRGIEKAYKNSRFKILNKHSKGLSVLNIYIITFLIIFIIINFVLPAITSSIKDLIQSFPSYYNIAIEYLNNLEEGSILKQLNLIQYINHLQEINIGEEILNWISIDRITSYVKGFLGATGIIIDIFVTLVVSIYLLLERSEIKEFFKKLSKALFDEKMNKSISNYFEKTNLIFFNFISGQIIDALLVGIITAIAMILMKVDYAVLLGFLIGIFNIIPYFGAIVGVAISVIITIFTGGFAKAVWLAIVIIILQQIDANIINPKILGNSLNVSPILVIFAVTFGGTYFGVLGMFLGVPVITLLKLLVVDFIDFRNKRNEHQIEDNTLEN